MIILCSPCLFQKLASIIIQITLNMHVPHSIDREKFSWFSALKLTFYYRMRMFVIYPLFLRCKEGYQGVRCDQFLPKTDSILSDPSTSNVFLTYLFCSGGCSCHARWPFAYCHKNVLWTFVVACRDSYCVCWLKQKNTSPSLCANKACCTAAEQAIRKLDSLRFGLVLFLFEARIFMVLHFWLEQVKLHDIKTDEFSRQSGPPIEGEKCLLSRTSEIMSTQYLFYYLLLFLQFTQNHIFHYMSDLALCLQSKDVLLSVINVEQNFLSPVSLC